MMSNWVYNEFGKQYLITVLVLMIPAMFSDILVETSVLETLFFISSSISVVAVSIYLFLVSSDKSKIRQRLNKNHKDPYTLGLAYIIGIPVFTFFGISKGLPTIIHIASSEPSTVIVTVKKRSHNYEGKYCRGSAYLIEFDYGLFNELCDIPKSTWKGVHSGTTFELTGSKSFIGFYPKSMKLTNKGNPTRINARLL